jgi:hypothetical protein
VEEIKSIWLIKWNTESGDEGIFGFFTKKLTKKQLDHYITKHAPDEFYDGECYIYYEQIELKKLD